MKDDAYEGLDTIQEIKCEFSYDVSDAETACKMPLVEKKLNEIIRVVNLLVEIENGRLNK